MAERAGRATLAIGQLRSRGLRKPRSRYYRIENSGISAAKNLGVFAAAGSILLFFDDDIAHPELLREHVRTHRLHPDENVAVLGFTEWAPTMRVTELMHFVNDVGCFLFSYMNLMDGQVLDFTYFWGGRSSCKRSFLVKHGVFNQQFRFGSEDIELGYRLSRFGLKVVFNRHALQYMNRPITFEEFCRRCEKQGSSQVSFARLHPHSALLQDYCRVSDACERWDEVEPNLAGAVRSVQELEELLRSSPRSGTRREIVEELLRLYRWTLNAFNLKGIV